MADQKSRGPAPFSLRLSLADRQLLERRAAGQPLSAYIRAQILCSAPQGDLIDPGLPEGRKAVARILGKLGESELSRSLARLAEAARMGALPVTPETETAIQQAATDIKDMRSALMAALRMKGS